VGEIGAFDELTEGRDELCPVRDERRLVEGASLGQTDEGGNGSADALDRTGATIELFDVDTRGQILRHTGLLLIDRGRSTTRLAAGGARS
jgi:hypothetical protein